MTTPPGHLPPGHPAYQQQQVYAQPVYPAVYGQEHPERPRLKGTQIVRGVLILAALAGVFTVAAGLMFWLGSPEEYAAPERTTLRSQAGALAPSVGPGGGQLTQADPSAPPPAPPLPAAPPLLPSSPKRLIIAKLGVNAPIKSVGLDKRGAIETPPISNSNLVGWYRGGPTAGQAGPAIMLGHKDTQTRSAVFSRLHELRYGDTIEVIRADGTIAVFTVGGVEQANKETFPTNRVYGNAEDAELRLITCGGNYNRATGHYVDNVIVYARMTSTRLANS
ncbi:class F sortase [Acrocarpospora corrugata]|uniref:Class F sortase n=1 Tax=Acrocarpospora corrugata TaxID=35763 RepID=A0A5M3VX63_9ACTN|nr:class F sortase [Acrocarpospora corrugata]GES00550.1 class F sortase [Acrocarpospora corrugata]